MKWITVVVLISALVSTSAYAGPADDSTPRAGGGIRASVERLRFDDKRRGSSYPPPYHLPRRNSTARKATAAFAIGSLGMLGGMFGGAWLDAMVNDCGCETAPIPTGALIGMPIGAAAGGILGWHLAR
jgi:hypothetical protein